MMAMMVRTVKSASGLSWLAADNGRPRRFSSLEFAAHAAEAARESGLNAKPWKWNDHRYFVAVA